MDEIELRDIFAACSLIGLLSDSVSQQQMVDAAKKEGRFVGELVAETAYAQADKMIERRNIYKSKL